MYSVDFSSGVSREEILRVTINAPRLTGYVRVILDEGWVVTGLLRLPS
jgi:hypothetical protein